MTGQTYEKPEVVIVNLAAIDEIIAYARCNGGAWSPGGCS